MSEKFATGQHYTQDPDFNPYLGYVGGGFFFFVVLNGVVKEWLTPAAASGSPQQRWKWRNIAVSFTHSTMTGVGAPLAFYLHPDMCEDMIHAYNTFTHALIGFSIGYFCYDFVDMALYNWGKRSTYELLFHHTCVIGCFGIAAHTRMFFPYASLALMVEINSIFLHLRQLLLIAVRKIIKNPR